MSRSRRHRPVPLGLPGALLGASLALLLAAGGCAEKTAARLSPPGPLPPKSSATATVEAPPRPAPQAPPAIPPGLLKPGATLTLADIVDIALQNNPITRATWFQARAAAAAAGARRAPYYPLVDGSVGVTGSQQASSSGQQADPAAVSSAGLSVTYLLLDFGGRAASAKEAYWGLVSADWTHNAAIQNAVFSVQQSYFQYLDSKAQVEAARATLESAKRNLEAAKGRHGAGVATIADVLQAQTQTSQAELNLELLEGIVMALRGTLATAMGLPATLPLDVGSLPGEVPTGQAQQAVEGLVSAAVMQRPDLAAARAQVERAARRVDIARSDSLPALVTNGSLNGGAYLPGPYGDYRTNWSARVLLTVPLFSGFARSYEIQRTQAELEAVRALAETLEQQVILQVWTSYYALQTATRRVLTSQDLLASAEQSERVAFARYKEGVGTILDLLTAQAALANARSQEIQSRADWFLATARLARDTGAVAALNDKVVVQPKPPVP